jgi:hypothetical protein
LLPHAPPGDCIHVFNPRIRGFFAINFKSKIILLIKEKKHTPLIITLWLVAWTDGWIYNDFWVGMVGRDGTVLMLVLKP